MVSEKRAQILDVLSQNPFMSIEDMMDIHNWKRSPLYRQLRSMEEVHGWIAHANHEMEGSKPIHRFHLTRDGVYLLAETLGRPLPEIKQRVGATGRGLATYHRLIDILAGVYRCAGTIARCYETPRLAIHLFSAGPVDAVVRLPDSPYSLGVMMYRRALSLAYFERKLKKYAALGNDRPSCLLVISPGRMADHTVARLVALTYGGRAEVAPLDRLGRPGARVWRDPGSYADETRPWSTWDMLDRIPDRLPDAPVQDVQPQVKPFEGAALPRAGWKPAIVLTYGEHEALYTIADWPLAKADVIAALGDLKPSSLRKFVGTLRRRCLVSQVPVGTEDERPALTDKGIVYICRAARADYEKEKQLWSSETGADGMFRGGNLRALLHDIRHTDLVYDIARRFKGGAKLVRVRGIRITPAHKVERYFRPASARNTRSIRPDAIIDLEMPNKTRHVLLLEAERSGLSRRAMRNRLSHYDAYFRMERSRHDDPVSPWIAVVLEDAGSEANFSVAQVEAELTRLPTILTNMGELSRSQAGPFDPVWRRPGEYGQRRYLDERR